MRKLSAFAVILGLATAIHLDWHIARPAVHHPSLGWRWHWSIALPVFGLTAWYVSRVWEDRTLQASIWIVAFRTLRVACAAAVIAGCASEREADLDTGTATDGGEPRVPTSVIIDPLVRPGDTIAGLEVVAADLNEVAGQAGVAVGEVRFAGEVRLSGARRPHPSDPELDAVCFFPDSASAFRLPRLEVDTRISWFCFSNPDAARDLESSPPSPQTITIDDYRYIFSFSDVFNTARLVSVEGRSGR